jgi:origin recognition complex subunit 5
MPFPLDRLLAILGILLEGYDVDTRLPAPHITLPGEYTELEIGRAQVYGIVS